MIVKIKSGRKGRPLTLDTSELEKELYSDMQKATRRLEQFRKETKGVRDERILGTSTTAPDFAYETQALLQNASDLTYLQARKLKENLKTIKELASSQKRVYERALADQMQSEYLEKLEKTTQNMNKPTRIRAQRIKKAIESLDKRAKQKFFMSKSYQAPEKYGRYKKIVEWSRADSGNSQMSEDEAGIYLIQKRLERGLGIGDLERVFGEATPFDDDENPFE